MELFLQSLQIFFLYVFINLQAKWELTLLVDQLKEWEFQWLTEVLIQLILLVLINTKEKCPEE
jgi:hypothetical protein